MISMANEAMESAWDGEEGEHWSEYADRYDAASVRVMGAYLPTIGVKRDDRVLDVGCGAGGLSLELAALCQNGSVFGVDLSSKMLEVAAKRAATRGLTNTEFIRADAQTHAFPDATFDVAVSSFGVMFFDDPVAAFTNIGRALKPAGRVAFIAWRALPEQKWIMGLREALAMGRDLPFPPLEAPTPFSLSSPERNVELLTAAGFTDVASTPVDQPMILGATTDDAFAFAREIGIVKGLSDDLSEKQKQEGIANVRRFIADHETPDGVLVDSAAWIITARR
jgi:SAM-dependent methyltransferase